MELREPPQQTEDLDLSVVVPAHDAAPFLFDSVKELTAHCQEAGVSLQVIVVDDGSTDATFSVAEKLAAAEPCVEVLRLAKNRGKGAAVREGVARCRGRVVAFTDADLPYAPADVIAAARRAEEVGIAIGTRNVASHGKRGYDLRRKFASGLFGYLVRGMFSLDVEDTQCGLKAFRGRIARDLFAVSRVDGFAFDVELLMLAKHWGLAVAELPVVMRPAHEGSIRIFGQALRVVRELSRIHALKKRGLPERPSEHDDSRS